jgi:cyclophilin family peptidyl-prolyl cis-trans isomerase
MIPRSSSTAHLVRPISATRIAGIVVSLAITLGACSNTASPTPSPSGDGSSSVCPSSQPAALSEGETRTVQIETSKGAISIKVDGTLSPIAAGNFVALAACGFYDGVGFHRVVPDFVIQGGDPTGSGSGGPGYTIQDEPVTATYHRGTVAMARTTQPNSQGSQFFVVLSDDAARSLAGPNTYAIFGEVIDGMDAVDAIATAADAELPSNPIAMDSVTVSNP